jgi:hypothetical protein
MFIQQLSVFIENKDGRLEKVTKTLKDNQINILSLSLADTSEYGVLRLIVSEPVKGKEVLKQADFSVQLTNVIGVKVPHQIGMLHELLQMLSKEKVGVSYMYLLDSGKKPSMILKVSDSKKALSLLKEHQYEILTNEEVYKL